MAPPRASSISIVWKIIFLLPLSILIGERVVGVSKFYSNIDSFLSTTTSTGCQREAAAASALPPPPSVNNSTTFAFPFRRTLQQRIPLNELVREEGLTCPPKSRVLEDVHLPYTELFANNRRIPQIVHQTSKSKCVTNKVWNVLQHWSFSDGWTHYLHSDTAIHRLLQQEWPEFPHLQQILPCLEGKGTLLADLWRYVVLWEYGGIYADVDTKPNKLNATTILVEDDGFFVVEQYHLLSQYFMAVSPKHPIMFYTIHHTLRILLEQLDTGIIPAPQVTGPHALNRGYQSFMRDSGVAIQDAGVGRKPAKAGLYTGTDGRSITVRGIGENENEYVHREYIRRVEKMRNYQDMGMKHFTKEQTTRSGKSCKRILWEVYTNSAEQETIAKR